MREAARHRCSRASRSSILVVGVNGSGKTTTIGKLARRLGEDGRSVMLAAGDTFRAAAIEQLNVWAERSGAAFAAQQAGADPGAVVFDALQSARSQQIDVLLADTAGRLHSQSHLMEELKKVKRVIQRVDPTAPHEVLLVLDANQGQNALSQAVQFHEAVGVTGLVLTKLDGTAKGGIVIAIARKLGLPDPLHRRRRAAGGFRRVRRAGLRRRARRRAMPEPEDGDSVDDRLRPRRQALSERPRGARGRHASASNPGEMVFLTGRPARARARCSSSSRCSSGPRAAR